MNVLIFLVGGLVLVLLIFLSIIAHRVFSKAEQTSKEIQELREQIRNSHGTRY